MAVLMQGLVLWWCQLLHVASQELQCPDNGRAEDAAALRRSTSRCLRGVRTELPPREAVGVNNVKSKLAENFDRRRVLVRCDCVLAPILCTAGCLRGQRKGQHVVLCQIADGMFPYNHNSSYMRSLPSHLCRSHGEIPLPIQAGANRQCRLDRHG